MAITPTKEQFTEFAQGRQEGEVVMINLLHFGRSDDTPEERRPAARAPARTPIATTAPR